ncbi:MAG: phosphodiester glycosidase family protein [Patescibacteria group bacterium]
MQRYHRAFALFTAIIALSLTGTGCQSTRNTPTDSSPAPISETQQVRWQKNDSGFETIPVMNQGSTTTIGVMHAFDPSRFRFAFDTATSGKSVVEWLSTSSSLVAVMNGAYFHEDFTPAGMLIHQGKEQNKRRFDADKSAVIRLAPNPSIVDTNKKFDVTGALEAAQSYPVLLRGRHSTITEDSGKKARRSFVGMRDDGFVVFGVIAKSEITLYELSQLLSRDEYRLASALNMDGGSSTGLFSHDEKTPSFNSVFPVPNVMEVYKK